MQFTMSIETGNAGMDDPQDVSRAIHEVAVRVSDGLTTGTIRDYNGHAVGTWTYQPADPADPADPEED